MLRHLTVENYALIDHLEMELDKNLNIITGETGAGKSILLGALGMLLGNKSDSSAIKDNSQNCIVEGTFSLEGHNLQALFEENDWDYDDTVVVRRMISPAGKSRAFINDLPVQLADLKQFGSRLIDIHSQHQNRVLSDELFRIHAIDLLAETHDILNQYRTEYNSLTALKRELANLKESAEQGQREQEWLTYQVDELMSANLQEGEVEELESELLMLENADRIAEALTSFRNRADDDSMGLLIQLKSSYKDFESISKSYAPAKDYAERLKSVLAELKDMNSSIAAECENVEADPVRLQKVSDRLNVIYTLSQKHRVSTLAELIDVRDKYSAQLNSIVQSDENISELNKKIEKCESKAQSLAAKIHAKREKATPKFEKEICSTLSMLGMPDTQFKVAITPLDRLIATGADRVEFLFSANKGASLQAVDRIASGGEISRVMLALKSLLAARMKLPTIIFDEIDTGVSGRIADAMGDIISSLSESMQVIDITHLPQVASKGETHFVVYKRDGHTNITKLSKAERVEHIATMISGSHISEAALEQAQILLKK